MDGLRAGSFSGCAKGDGSILSGFSRASIPMGGRGRIPTPFKIVNRVECRSGNKLVRIVKIIIPGESESGTCCNCDVEEWFGWENNNPGSIALPIGPIESSGGFGL